MNDGTLYAIATARRLCLIPRLFRRAGRLSMRRGCTGERLITDESTGSGLRPNRSPHLSGTGTYGSDSVFMFLSPRTPASTV